MGVDWADSYAIELLVLVEREFSIELPYDEIDEVDTVGALYRFVLNVLDVAYQPSVEIESLRRPYPSVISPTATRSSLWTTATVWHSLKNLIVNNFHLDQRLVRDSTRLETLGS